MDTRQFWKLIEDARARVADAADSESIAARAVVSLSAFPRKEIVDAQRVLTGLLAASYRNALWAAASLINGGCGDDGFEYFRGWLIVQGREVFNRSVADPDSLADLPVIGPPTLDRPLIECEETLYIAMRAYRAATGAELPVDAFTIRYPEPDAGWDFDFGDRTKMEQRLPRLTALCWPEVTHSLGGRFECCARDEDRFLLVLMPLDVRGFYLLWARGGHAPTPIAARRRGFLRVRPLGGASRLRAAYPPMGMRAGTTNRRRD